MTPALVVEGLLHCLEFLYAFFTKVHLSTTGKTWMICAVGFGVTLSEKPHGMGGVDAHTHTNPRTVAAGGTVVMKKNDTKLDIDASWLRTIRWNHVNTKRRDPCYRMMKNNIVAEMQDKVKRRRREPQRAV